MPQWLTVTHWLSTLQIAEKWLLWKHALCETETGLVDSRSECWMRLVPMALPSSTDAFQTQTMFSKSLVLSNGSDRHILMMPSLNDSRGMSLFSQQQTTPSFVVMRGWRHNQHHHQHVDKVFNHTLLMKKHPPWLVDANKWCDNKVDTRDVHCALKPLYGSQRRTQIVMSVSKVAWMRIT